MSDRTLSTFYINTLPASPNVHRPFSEYGLRNTVRNDPLLDYLRMYGEMKGFQPDPKSYNPFDKRMEFSVFTNKQSQQLLEKTLEGFVSRLQTKFPNGDAFSNQSNPTALSEIRNSLGLRSDSWHFQVAHTQDDIKNPEKDAETRLAMGCGVPILVKPVLRVHSKNWVCCPDLLIRSDLLPHLWDTMDHDGIAETLHEPAPSINLESFHYVVVLVRFISLHMNSFRSEELNGFTARNIGNVLLYKTMLAYQNLILEHVQGYAPQRAFLCGRSSEWKHPDQYLEGNPDYGMEELEYMESENNNIEDEEQEEEGEEESRDANVGGIRSLLSSSPVVNHMSNNNHNNNNNSPREAHHALYAAAHVVFYISDSKYIAKEVKSSSSNTNNSNNNSNLIMSTKPPIPEPQVIKSLYQHIQTAIHWNNWLNSAEAVNWSLFQPQVDNAKYACLLPNMKNQESFPWHHAKKDLAQELGEISQLWQMTNKLRRECHRQKVWSLRQPEFAVILQNHFCKPPPAAQPQSQEEQSPSIQPQDNTNSNNSNSNSSGNSNAHNNSDNETDVKMVVLDETKHQSQNENKTESSSDDESSQSRRYVIMRKLWEINHGTGGSSSSSEPVVPAVIQNDLFGWKQERRVEFFVDFETTENLRERFQNFPEKERQTFIVVIGSTRIIRSSTTREIVEYEHRCFAMNFISPEEEIRILEEWFGYMMSVCRQFRVDYWDRSQVALFHWSAAETKFLYTNSQAAFRRHWQHAISHNWPFQLPFLDFMQVMMTEPVCIRGCYNFKLKNMAKALHQLGKIEVQWPNSQVDNGLNAMTAVFLCDEDRLRLNNADNMDVNSCNQQNNNSNRNNNNNLMNLINQHRNQRNNSGNNHSMSVSSNNSSNNGRNQVGDSVPSMLNVPLMKEIIKYNEIDCIAMFKIVDYLRHNHIG